MNWAIWKTLWAWIFTRITFMVQYPSHWVGLQSFAFCKFFCSLSDIVLLVLSGELWYSVLVPPTVVLIIMDNSIWDELRFERHHCQMEQSCSPLIASFHLVESTILFFVLAFLIKHCLFLFLKLTSLCCYLLWLWKDSRLNNNSLTGHIPISLTNVEKLQLLWVIGLLFLSCRHLCRASLWL